MASRAIVAFLTVCAVALASGQDAPPVDTPPAGSQGAMVDATLSITLSLSPPDVQAAIKEIRDNSAELRDFIDQAIARISSDAQNAVDKLDSFLQNLQEGVQAAGDRLSEELKGKISSAVDKIRELIALKRQFLKDAVEQARKQLDEASQTLRKNVAKITEYIQKSLAAIRDAVNSSPLLLRSLKDRVNAAIAQLNANVTGQEIQTAIQNSIEKLGGSVGFGDVLKAISAQLLIAGNSVSAGIVGAVGSAYSNVSGILGGGFSGVGSLTLDISFGGGASAAAA